MVVVDRFKAYAFLKELLQLAYCWAHVRRDFVYLRLGGKGEEAWADGWIERIGQLYKLNAQRLTLAKSPNRPESLPAPGASTNTNVPGIEAANGAKPSTKIERARLPVAPIFQSVFAERFI